jgi:hypothetical protein
MRHGQSDCTLWTALDERRRGNLQPVTCNEDFIAARRGKEERNERWRLVHALRIFIGIVNVLGYPVRNRTATKFKNLQKVRPHVVGVPSIVDLRSWPGAVIRRMRRFLFHFSSGNEFRLIRSFWMRRSIILLVMRGRNTLTPSLELLDCSTVAHVSRLSTPVYVYGG